jgi:hypothetical protein
VRTDLTLPQQIVQSCHAAIEVAKSLLPAELPHPHLVVCAVPGEIQLFHCIDRLRRNGIEYRAYHEPDRGNQLTAIGTEPIFGERRRIFKRYRCLSEPGFT